MGDNASGKLEEKHKNEIVVLSATVALLALGWFVHDRVIGPGGWRIYQSEFKQLELDQLRARLKDVQSAQLHRLKKLAYAPKHAEFAGDRSNSKLIEDLKLAIAGIESRPLAEAEIVVHDLKHQRVDRCTTCHQGIERPQFSNTLRPVFRTHPDLEGLLKQHPVKKFGCTVCHEGQGGNLDVRHGPILKGKMVESSCVRCHEDAPLLPGAVIAAEGARLYQSKGCYACHQVDRSPYLTANLGFFGPDLKGIKGKVRPEWLATWIKNPRKIHPRTMMPRFGAKNAGLPDLEAVQLASYLLSVSHVTPLPAKAAAYGLTTHTKESSVALGRELFEKRGCLGCHDLGKNRSAGPRHISLDGIGSKVSRQWIYAWIENPQAMSATTLMPRFALKEDEIASLADYLSMNKQDKLEYVACKPGDMTCLPNIEAGKKLIGRYGCYNCHSIPGFENNSQKIGPALTDFGARDPLTLSWGKAKNAVARKQRNWYTWTLAKLKDPKVFETRRVKKDMPNSDLTPQEIDKIIVFLKSLSSEQTTGSKYLRRLKPGQAAAIAGGYLLDHYGCMGCHSMYEARTFDAYLRGEHAGDENFEVVVRGGTLAPNLSNTGERVRSDWLLDFLNKPYKMRPYLAASMPTFHFRNRDDRTLVKYFQAAGNPRNSLAKDDRSMMGGAAAAETGEKLFNSLQCATCHQMNGKDISTAGRLNWYHNMQNARRLAPDLAYVRGKLNRQWAVRWIENPHLLMPDTTMPYLALTEEEAAQLASYLECAFAKAKSSKTSY